MSFQSSEAAKSREGSSNSTFLRDHRALSSGVLGEKVTEKVLERKKGTSLEVLLLILWPVWWWWQFRSGGGGSFVVVVVAVFWC